MNVNVQVAALEEQNGNVFGLQMRYAVAHIYTHPVKQVVAVRFDY
jgi:hypothetical protein